MKMENKEYSKEHILYLKKIKRDLNKIRFIQIFILIGFIILWEALANLKIIDSFIMSSPSRVLNTFLTLYSTGQLWNNIIITVIETIAGFILGTSLGMILATLIWWSSFILKVVEP